MDIQHSGHSLPVDVALWAFPMNLDISKESKTSKESAKIRTICHHPTLQWVAGVTKLDEIEVWDLTRRDVLWRSTLREIFDNVEAPSVRQLDKQEDGAKTFAKIGSVVDLKFMDADVLAWQCGVRPGPATQRSGNAHMLWVLCENAAFKCDLLLGTTRMISNEDLKRNAPKCLVPIFPTLVAIGCSDGAIRVWDTYNWIIASTLQSHTRDVLALKVLTVKADGRAPGEGNFSAKSSDSVLEGKLRMVSLGLDGLGLLWESNIVGNIVENTSPTACLSGTIGGAFLDIDYDSSTDTLITITSDKRIKLWDMSGQATSPRHTPRSKLSRGVSEMKTIPTVGMVKFSASVSKYSHCAALAHPRYQRGSFAVSFKNDVIIICKAFETSGDGPATESRSSHSHAIDTVVQWLQPVQEIHMTSLLHSFLERREQNFSPAVMTKLHELLNLGCKVYEVHAHPLRPTVLTCCTNFGFIVLTIDNGHTDIVAAHPAWHGALFTYDESVVHHTTVHSDSPQTPSSLDQVMAVRADPVGVFTTHGGALNPSVMSGASGAKLHSMSATDTSRPRLFPSPSGKYLALWWPESTLYIVLDVSAAIGQRGAPSSSSSAQYQEVDRGNCLSFGWVGPHDLYTLIQPGMMLNSGPTPNQKEKKWTMGRQKKQSLTGHFTPPLLVVKFITPDGVITTGAPGGPEHALQVHSGLLLCITHAVVVDPRAGKRAVSAVELADKGAGAAEQKEGAGTDGTTSIPAGAEVREIRSQFFKCEYTGSRDEFSATNIRLVAAGPAMPRVRKVEWDFVTGHCAAVIGTKVNIMSVFPTFQSLACVEVCSPSQGPPTSLCWSNGVLFVAAQAALAAVFTEYPYSQDSERRLMRYHGSRADVVVLADHNSHSTLDPARMLAHTSADYNVAPMMPGGFQQVVAVHQSKLLLSGWDGTLTAFPLTTSSICTMGMLLANKQVSHAMTWARRIHLAQHDRIALMLARRGLVEESLSLDIVGWQLRVEICLHFGLDERLTELIEHVPTPLHSAIGGVEAKLPIETGALAARSVLVRIAIYCKQRGFTAQLRSFATKCVEQAEGGASILQETILVTMLTQDPLLMARAYAVNGMIVEAATLAMRHPEIPELQAYEYEQKWRDLLQQNTRFVGLSF